MFFKGSQKISHDLYSVTGHTDTRRKASSREETFWQRIRRQVLEMERASVDYGYRAAMANWASGLLTSSVVDLFRGLGIAAVAYSNLSVGMMIGFLFYLSNLVQPVNQLTSLVINHVSVCSALDRLNNILSLGQEHAYLNKADPFAESVPVSIEKVL